MATAQAPSAAIARQKRLSRRARWLIFLVAWLIVLMPFLFWRSTWFGRPLSDAELTQYLHDTTKPRHIQHALVQIGERLSRRAASAAANQDARSIEQWYPDLVNLTSSPVEEVRTTDAWVIGQAPQQPEFHAALLGLLKDASLNVRNNAALALVRYGDASGHAQIVSMLRPVTVVAPVSGVVSQVANAGEPIRNATVVARISADNSQDVRSPITGSVAAVAVKNGAAVSAGAPIATIDPGTDQVWEALRALYFIGSAEDLNEVKGYERPQPHIADRVQQQARDTERAIRARLGK
jgi:HEAT repeat protein